LISYEKEVEIDKLNNHLKITGFINNILRPQVTLKKTRMKLYGTLCLSSTYSVVKIWTIKEKTQEE
jgi:hypothetical protein